MPPLSLMASIRFHSWQKALRADTSTLPRLLLLDVIMPPGGIGFLVLLFAIVLLPTACLGACYFPLDLQGEFLMQSSPLNSGSPVLYSQVIITAETISIWGQCHRRIDTNVVLKDSLGGLHNSGTPECFRCFQLQPRSRNVIEFLAESLDKCYMSEEVATSNCPDERARNRAFSRIILYKTKDLLGEETRPVYCPINGRFTFIYNRNDDLENKLACHTPMSELDNCPSGAELNLHFKQCLSEHFDMTFQCLGSWPANNNQYYLALLDRHSPAEKQPKYRCAMFREVAGTGSIQMAFSKDSTCTTDLISSSSGYETVILTPIQSKGWPDAAYAAKCIFPDWAEGKWQHVTVENNTLTYIDHEKFKTYTLRCLNTAANPERFFVFARTQCGEELYTCIWLKYRGINVMEFQIGSYSTGSFNESLCSDYNFRDTTWITQGRTRRFKESPCPIRGEYTGIIPDAVSPRLCAKLSSDCKAPELMYYTVSECDQPEIYEGSRIRIRNRRDSSIETYQINEPNPSATTISSQTQIPSSENPNPIDRRQLHDSEIHLDMKASGIGHQFSSSQPPPETLVSQTNVQRSKSDSQVSAYTDFNEPEEYDPWAYSQTNGFQNNSRSNSNNSTNNWQKSQYDQRYNRREYSNSQFSFQNSNNRNYSPNNQPETRYNNSQTNYFQTYDTGGWNRRTYSTSIPNQENIPNMYSTNNPYFSRNPTQQENTYVHNYYPKNVNTPDTPLNRGNTPQEAYSPKENFPLNRSRYNFPENRFRGNVNISQERGTFSYDRSRDYINNSQERNFSQGRSRDNINIPQENYNRGNFPQDRSRDNTNLFQDGSRYNNFPQEHFRGNINNSQEETKDRSRDNVNIPQENYPYDRSRYNFSQDRFRDQERNRDNIPQYPFRNNFPQDRNREYFSQARPREGFPEIRSRENTPQDPQNRSFNPRTSNQQNPPFVNNYPRVQSIPWPHRRPQSIEIPQIVNIQNPVSYDSFRSDRRNAAPRRSAPSYREEREYRCLGQWEENGRVYTFTQRRDAASYECFVGSTSNEINIKEAGEHCDRRIDPLNDGMKLNRIGSCWESDLNSNVEKNVPPPRQQQNTTRITPRPEIQPTKPWKPITAPPRVINNNHHNSAVKSYYSTRLLIVCLNLLSLYKYISC